MWRSQNSAPAAKKQRFLETMLRAVLFDKLIYWFMNSWTNSKPKILKSYLLHYPNWPLVKFWMPLYHLRLWHVLFVACSSQHGSFAQQEQDGNLKPDEERMINHLGFQLNARHSMYCVYMLHCLCFQQSCNLLSLSLSVSCIYHMFCTNRIHTCCCKVIVTHCINWWHGITQR